jgi:hypothetical protein
LRHADTSRDERFELGDLRSLADPSALEDAGDRARFLVAELRP